MFERQRALHCTYSCVDLAIVCGHAVSMVEVSEGLGSAPGLQVSCHSDRRSHLPAVKRGTRAHAQQRAVPLSLGKTTGTKKLNTELYVRLLSGHHCSHIR